VSRVLVRLLTCDDDECTEKFLCQPGVFGLPALRKSAQSAGWRQGRGDTDYCPQHRPSWPGLTAWVRRTDFAETDAAGYVESFAAFDARLGGPR
jgi:hypothetical protein